MSGGSASVKSDLPVLGVAAMTTEIAVSPAMSLADRGSPGRFAPDRPGRPPRPRRGGAGKKKPPSRPPPLHRPYRPAPPKPRTLRQKLPPPPTIYASRHSSARIVGPSEH